MSAEAAVPHLPAEAGRRAPMPGEGLRERKKRLMRQLISDTATAMFLERGFEGVRVAEVAAACEVSEKTVYNYFPTKESLILDHEEGMAEAIRQALGPDAGPGSPTDAVIGLIAGELRRIYSDRESGPDFLHIVHRFHELFQSTPSLRAAQGDMMERLTEVAAQAMAGRAGLDPDDPEPQIAADALMGLWRVMFRASRRYSDGARSPAQVRDQALAEVRRAARLIDTGLWSFSLAVQGPGREQAAAGARDAARARQQVHAALRQARADWQGGWRQPPAGRRGLPGSGELPT